jgi:hypothetical protein
VFGHRLSWLGVLAVVQVGDCQGALLYFRAVLCAAFAARIVAVWIGSGWTNPLIGPPWMLAVARR